MENLAKAIKLAAKLRNESYDIKAATVANRNRDFKKIDFNKFYQVSIYDAADKAALKYGIDKGTLPIYLLLVNSWNQILEWCEQFDEIEEES